MDNKIYSLDLCDGLSAERSKHISFVLEHFHHLMVMQRYIGASAEKDVDRTCRAHLDRALSSSTAAGSWELRGKHSPDQSDRTCRAERNGSAIAMTRESTPCARACNRTVVYVYSRVACHVVRSLWERIVSHGY